MTNPKPQSPKVTKRIQEFETKKQALISDGYQEEKLLINIVFANIFALIMAIPIILLFILALFLGAFHNQTLTIGFSGILLIPLTFIFLIVLHEFLHGLTWSFFAVGGWRFIEFGVMWQYLTPYCTCKVPLKKYQYIIGGIVPTIVLGIIPLIISLLMGSAGLFIIAGIMFISGAGDVLIVNKLFRHKAVGKDCIYIDHPTEGGLVAFEKK